MSEEDILREAVESIDSYYKIVSLKDRSEVNIVNNTVTV